MTEDISLEETSFAIQVGVEELLFLLFTMGYRTLPGLGENMTEGLDQDQLERALAAGYNSLRARGWVRPSEGLASKVEVDSTIIALLVTCATADRILFIIRQPVDGPPEVRYIHFGPYLTALHYKVAGGIHRIVGIVGTAEPFIMQELHLTQQQTTDAHTIEISRERLDALITALNHGSLENGIQVLTAHDLPEYTAKALAESISTMRANTMVAMLSLGAENVESPVDGFSLLESDAGFWMLESVAHQNDDNQLVITSISAENCLDRLKSIMPVV